MKLLAKVFGGLILVVVIVLGASVYYLDNIIKEAVVRVTPEVTGTATELDSVHLSLLGGSASLKGLTIGNPQGFQDPNAFSLGAIEVELDINSLMSDVIHIRSILIAAPQIAYESGDAGDNLQTLLSNISENMGSSDSNDEEATASESTKKLIIDRFLLTDAAISVRHSLLSEPLSVGLDSLELTDIGRDSNGATPEQAASEIIKQISSAAIKAVSSSALVDQARQKLDAQVDEAKAKLGDKASELGVDEEKLDAVKGLFKGFGN